VLGVTDHPVGLQQVGQAHDGDHAVEQEPRHEQDSVLDASDRYHAVTPRQRVRSSSIQLFVRDWARSNFIVSRSSLRNLHMLLKTHLTVDNANVF
jgi:hypothetical protein